MYAAMRCNFLTTLRTRKMTALNRRMLLVVNDDDLVANAKRRLQQKVDVASFLRYVTSIAVDRIY